MKKKGFKDNYIDLPSINSVDATINIVALILDCDVEYPDYELMYCVNLDGIHDKYISIPDLVYNAIYNKLDEEIDEDIHNAFCEMARYAKHGDV